MSTPACIANAVADALGLSDVQLPLLPATLAAQIHGPEPAPPARIAKPAAGERRLHGEGRTAVAAPREQLWAMLLDPDALLRIVPGAHGVERVSETEYRAEVTLGVGPVKGRYRVALSLSDMQVPEAVTLSGRADGALGFGQGNGRVILEEAPGGTVITWRYDAAVGGKVASIAGRLLDGAARVVIGQFFAALARQATPAARPGWLARLLRALGLGR